MRLRIAGRGVWGAMPSSSFFLVSSTKKPASADMKEKAIQANSSTNNTRMIDSRTVTPPT